MPEPGVHHVPSKAAVKGHPIHPMLIPLPITLFVLALLTDVVYVAVGDAVWATASEWLLWTGVAAGALAAVPGAVDFFTRERIRRHPTAQQHAIGNTLAILLTAVNAWLRMGPAGDAVLPYGIVLSAVVVLIIAYTGWLGGEMSYRHLFGANPGVRVEDEPLFGSRERTA